MSMGNAQKKRFIDKEIYQKSSYGNDVPSESYLPSSIPKHAEFTHPASPLARDFIYEWFLKLKDKGQDLTGTISWINLPLKKQIRQFMFPRLTLALVLSFQQDGKTILWAYSERWSFLKWQFDRRKKSLPPAEAYQKAYLQQKFLPRSIAWEFIYKSRTGKSQDTKQKMRLNGAVKPQRIT